MSYQYKPLAHPDRSIRLLELQPPKYFFHRSPRCRLLEYELYSGERPAYEALSYAWGSPDRSSHIICDGRTLTVTPNCRAALTQLSEKITKPRLLWVDALCINQQDVEERNEQVRRMQHIFGRAQRCIVWLGKEGEESGMCLAEMNRAMQEAPWKECYDENGGFIQGEENSRLFNRLIVETGRKFTDKSSPLRKATAALLHRPWFTRMWVLQEVGVAHKVDILCGNATLSWDNFNMIMSIMRRSVTDHQDASLTFGNHVLHIIELRKRFWEGFTLKDASHALRIGSEFEATDPRDRVYALLGLFLPLASAIGKPDYGNHSRTYEVLRREADAHISDLYRELADGAGIDADQIQYRDIHLAFPGCAAFPQITATKIEK